MKEQRKHLARYPTCGRVPSHRLHPVSESVEVEIVNHIRITTSDKSFDIPEGELIGRR